MIRNSITILTLVLGLQNTLVAQVLKEKDFIGIWQTISYYNLDEKKDQLITKEMAKYCEYHFMSDGSVTTMFNTDKIVHQGTWEILNDTLYVQYPDLYLEKAGGPGKKHALPVKKITKKHLYLHAIDGGHNYGYFTFLRMKK